MRVGGGFVLLFALAARLDANVIVQSVAAEPALQQVTAGASAEITVVYDCESSQPPGLGVRVHYDSSRLTLDRHDVLFAPGFIAVQDQSDSEDADGDPTTDRRVLVAWAATTAGWPGPEVKRPLELMRVRFDALPGRPATGINVTGHACGFCRFEGHAATIEIVDAQLPPSDDVPPPPRGFDAPTPVPAIPTLSEVGAGLLVVALAGVALALLRRR
jgi:hypothetical protein